MAISLFQHSGLREICYYKTSSKTSGRRYVQVKKILNGMDFSLTDLTLLFIWFLSSDGRETKALRNNQKRQLSQQNTDYVGL